MDLSLFYFAADAEQPDPDRYALLLDGARFADRHGFAAVWTPERHFHRFGGDYPNPAVTGAAVAAVTRDVAVRAGSVVAPLHHVLRIAEDWAVVDNLSGGRAGISLGTGWNRADFVLSRTPYDDRAATTGRYIDTLRRLWRGESLDGPDGPRVFPLPVRGELPMWLSTGGSPRSVEAAGRAGVGILTHLAAQSHTELGERIGCYRRAYAAAGHAGSGHVVLMLHTYLGEDLASVEREVREPLQTYLMSAMNLFQAGSAAAGAAAGADRGARARLAVQPAYHRYVHEAAALFGSVDEAATTARMFRDLGVDEIACLIDFGLPTAAVRAGFDRLAQLREVLASHEMP